MPAKGTEYVTLEQLKDFFEHQVKPLIEQVPSVTVTAAQGDLTVGDLSACDKAVIKIGETSITVPYVTVQHNGGND